MRTPDSVESSLKVIVFDWNLGSLPNVLGMTDIALSLLMNRRTLRRWFPLNVGGDKCFTGHCGEVELALRWIHNPEFPPCLLYTSPSPRDLSTSRMPSSA